MHSSDTRRASVFVNAKSPSVQSMARNGIGRPSKGERDAILAKPVLPFGAILKENADKEGLSYGDYLILLAAERLDLPQYAPRPPRDRAAELDIPREANPAAA